MMFNSYTFKILERGQKPILQMKQPRQAESSWSQSERLEQIREIIALIIGSHFLVLLDTHTFPFLW